MFEKPLTDEEMEILLKGIGIRDGYAVAKCSEQWRPHAPGV